MHQQTEAPIITEYTVKRTLTGKAKGLAFHCPNCNASLSADLTDAGTDETCPKCAALFRVPLYEEPPAKPPAKEGPAWHERDIFGRDENETLRAKVKENVEEIVTRERPSREPVPYQFLLSAGVILSFLGVLTIVATVVATIGMLIDDLHGGITATVFFGGIINGFILVVAGQALHAFRDLVMATKSIDERLGKRKR